MDLHPINVLSLCTGIGGIELGLRAAGAGARTACYVERSPYCRRVLVARVRDGLLDDAPIWDDLRTFDGSAWRGRIDIVAAGFPCQPASRVGRRQGSRHPDWLWPDVLRVVRECGAGIVFGENVDALRSNGGPGIVADLAALGYAVAWDLFSARAAGAPHSRPRLFILAAERQRLDDALRGRHRPAAEEIFAGWQGTFPPSPRILCGDVGLRAGWPEPGLPRGADGPADRVDRLHAAGNGVVPVVAARAWLILSDRIRRYTAGLFAAGHTLGVTYCRG